MVTDEVFEFVETSGPEKGIVPGAAMFDLLVVHVLVHLAYQPSCDVWSASVIDEEWIFTQELGLVQYLCMFVCVRACCVRTCIVSLGRMFSGAECEYALVPNYLTVKTDRPKSVSLYYKNYREKNTLIFFCPKSSLFLKLPRDCNMLSTQND